RSRGSLRRRQSGGAVEDLPVVSLSMFSSFVSIPSQPHRHNAGEVRAVGDPQRGVLIGDADPELIRAREPRGVVEVGEVYAERFTFLPAACIDDGRHRAGVRVFTVDLDTLCDAAQADSSRSLPDCRSDLVERLKESSFREAELILRRLRKHLLPSRELLRL